MRIGTIFYLNNRNWPISIYKDSRRLLMSANGKKLCIKSRNGFNLNNHNFPMNMTWITTQKEATQTKPLLMNVI